MWLVVALACGYSLVIMATRAFLGSGSKTDEIVRESRQAPEDVSIAMWLLSVVWPIVWLYLAGSKMIDMVRRAP
jgi:hypothetical protein